MALLPAEERDILFHAYWLRWTVERIARNFDVSPDIIRLRLHEALQRLLAGTASLPRGTPRRLVRVRRAWRRA
jgi:DNA-directed RNA polymerase specialized sigma24 family protein